MTGDDPLSRKPLEVPSFEETNWKFHGTLAERMFRRVSGSWFRVVPLEALGKEVGKPG